MIFSIYFISSNIIKFVSKTRKLTRRLSLLDRLTPPDSPDVDMMTEDDVLEAPVTILEVRKCVRVNNPNICAGGGSRIPILVTRNIHLLHCCKMLSTLICLCFLSELSVWVCTGLNTLESND